MASPEVTRWCAVPGVLASVPGQAARHGMRAEYIGRAVDEKAFASHETDVDKLYPLSADNNCAFARADGQAIQSELFRMAKNDGVIAPADETTAAWCGVPMKTQAAPPVQVSAPIQPRTRRTAPSEDSSQ